MLTILMLLVQAAGVFWIIMHLAKEEGAELLVASQAKGIRLQRAAAAAFDAEARPEAGEPTPPEEKRQDRDRGRHGRPARRLRLPDPVDMTPDEPPQAASDADPEFRASDHFLSDEFDLSQRARRTERERRAAGAQRPIKSRRRT